MARARKHAAFIHGVRLVLDKLINQLEILIRYAWLPCLNGWSYVNHVSENKFESVC